MTRRKRGDEEGRWRGGERVRSRTQFCNKGASEIFERRKNRVEFECAPFMRGTVRNCFSVVGPVIACSGRNENGPLRGEGEEGKRGVEEG